MSIADFVVFLSFFQIQIVRSKEFSLLCNVVGGPLTGGREDECVSKVILLLFLDGGAPGCAKGGRATLWTSELYDYDCTMVYPGEDVCTSSFISL